jgi:hypothetical protein
MRVGRVVIFNIMRQWVRTQGEEAQESITARTTSLRREGEGLLLVVVAMLSYVGDGDEG